MNVPRNLASKFVVVCLMVASLVVFCGVVGAQTGGTCLNGSGGTTALFGNCLGCSGCGNIGAFSPIGTPCTVLAGQLCPCWLCACTRHAYAVICL